MDSSASQAARIAVTAAEVTADSNQLDTEITAGHNREGMLTALTCIRSTLRVVTEALDLAQAENARLLAEIDQLRVSLHPPDPT